TAAAPKKGQLYIGFGPSLLQPDSCGIGQLDCAEEDLLRTFQRGSWAGSRTRVLFDSDDMVQEYHARVTHFEILHDIRGKLLGVGAVIATPLSNVMAYCMYKEEDQSQAEDSCETFISSLSVKVPERFVYVQH